MSRPRVRTLSGGRRAGVARTLSPAPWWLRTQRPDAGASSRWIGGFAPAGHAADEARTSRRLTAVADLMDAAQRARNRAAVWTALATALRRLGLNGYAALHADRGTFPAGGMLAVSAAGAAEIERILGRAPAAARLGPADATPYRTVLESGRTARVNTPQWWARLALPDLGEQEARAVARLLRLGDAAMAPIVAGDDVLGVLTVWASRLSDADLALATILGRVAGDALSALAGDAAPRGWRGERTAPAAA